MTEHDEIRESLGAYVLGALDTVETAEVTAHLHTCESCRLDYSRLAGLPNALAMVPPDAWEPEPPSDLLLGRLLTRLSAEQDADRRVQRRRLVAGSVAAAIAAAIIGGGSVAWLRNATDSSVGDPNTVQTAASWRLSGRSADGDVWGSVTVIPVAWGSRMELKLDGVQAGQECSLVVTDTSGRVWDGGSWRVSSYTKDFGWTGGVALADSDIAEVKVLADNGDTLLALQR
jgi:predicted anti-sigma-YlaC factor YlaD